MVTIFHSFLTIFMALKGLVNKCNVSNYFALNMHFCQVFNSLLNQLISEGKPGTRDVTKYLLKQKFYQKKIMLP